ncbi:MAG: serine/threonine-protein kinase [Bryobacteraceae bacterium]
MPLSPSTRLGFYEILAPIGSGGMGEVYRAKDTRLGREVALKILTPGKDGSEERKQRFLQEAQSASSLHHPNIITIFDVGSENGIDYIAMELVKGKPLEELIPRTGFRFNEVLKYGMQIADALVSAHSAGIVHRDLKPANIMITEDGQAKLLDFGLAKLTEKSIISDSDATITDVTAGLTVAGTILGTVSYMSPEQAEGKKIDVRSDIFSFGSIMYEMLTGKRAFQSDTMVSTLSAILRDEPEPVGPILDDVHGNLEGIISRCLRKDPDRRWNSMSDVKTALLELGRDSLSGSAINPKISTPRVLPQSPKTGWVLAAGVALVAAVAAWFTLGGGGKANYPMVPPTAPLTAGETAARKSSAFPATADAPLTNAQVIEMVSSGVGKSAIISHIRESKTNFTFTTEDLIALAKNSVPDDVVEVMRNPQAADAPPPAAANPPLLVHATLNGGHEVPLLAASDIPFSAAGDGSRIAFVAAADVKSGDQVVIAKGAPGFGSLIDAEKKKFFGRGGKVTVRLESVKAVDGQNIKLRALPVTVNASKVKDIAVTKGTEFNASVEQDTAINLGLSQK